MHGSNVTVDGVPYPGPIWDEGGPVAEMKPHNQVMVSIAQSFGLQTDTIGDPQFVGGLGGFQERAARPSARTPTRLNRASSRHHGAVSHLEVLDRRRTTQVERVLARAAVPRAWPLARGDVRQAVLDLGPVAKALAASGRRLQLA